MGEDIDLGASGGFWIGEVVTCEYDLGGAVGGGGCECTANIRSTHHRVRSS